MTPDGTLFVVPDLGPDEEQALANALRDLGIEPQVRALPARRSADQVAWLVLAMLPLNSFLTALGTKAGEDGYHWLRSVIGRLAPKRVAESTAPLVIQDPGTGLQVVLPPDLPAQAYTQLLALDLTRFRLGPVYYDKQADHWRSLLDEAVDAAPDAG
jgi:hypothetical protein